MTPIPNQLDTLVVATHVMSTVRYATYPYNSFAILGGKYFGAGPDGLFELDTGDTDDGAPIDAHFETGSSDLDTSAQKRVSDVYVGMRSSGPLALDVTVDEAATYTYTIDPLAVATLNQRRTAIGKGARGVYWKFRLSNSGGCAFDVDTMNVAAASTNRRV